MLIQWYPGHMAKARRMLLENLKLIDVVVELVDARAPLATRNPDFDDLFKQKERVILLNKSDLASPLRTKEWVEKYRGDGIRATDFVATSSSRRKAAVQLIEEASAEKVQRMKAKGVMKTVRVMVVGIPNVGKSTFINRIAGKTSAQVGDRPGVTKGKQWVKITPYLELMDTPGMLWPKIEDDLLARHLAYIGSIRDDIMDVEQLSSLLLSDLMRMCLKEVVARYNKIEEGMIPEDLLEAVCESRGFILQGERPDTERAARIVLDEFRAGRIARVTLDDVDYVPSEVNADGEAENEKE